MRGRFAEQLLLNDVDEAAWAGLHRDCLRAAIELARATFHAPLRESVHALFVLAHDIALLRANRDAVTAADAFLRVKCNHSCLLRK